MASLLFVPYQGEIKGDPGVTASKHCFTEFFGFMAKKNFSPLNKMMSSLRQVSEDSLLGFVL